MNSWLFRRNTLVQGKGSEMAVETNVGGSRRALELVLFFLLTLVAWTIWIPQARYRLGLAESAVSLRSPANALTVWSPGLAAILLTNLSSRGPGLGALFGKLGRWRVGWQWYLVAVLFEPARWCLSLGIDRVLGRSYELGPMPLQVILGPAAAYMIPVALVFTHSERCGRGDRLARLRAAAAQGVARRAGGDSGARRVLGPVAHTGVDRTGPEPGVRSHGRSGPGPCCDRLRVHLDLLRFRRQPGSRGDLPRLYRVEELPLPGAADPDR